MFQPFTLTSTPKAKKDSSEASIRTLQRRNQNIKNHIENSCGKSSLTSQVGSLLKGVKMEQRSEILKMANIKPMEINAEEMVAMKVDLGIPWEKLKLMAR